MEYRYLFQENDFPVFAPWNSVPDAYSGCGCHPDIVEYLWGRIGVVLPADCRGLVYGTPALVHNKTGIIFAIGFGTICCLRLTGELGAEAVKAGAETIRKLQPEGRLDTQRELGVDWFLGPITPIQPIWSKRLYEIFDVV